MALRGMGLGMMLSAAAVCAGLSLPVTCRADAGAPPAADSGRGGEEFSPFRPIERKPGELYGDRDLARLDLPDRLSEIRLRNYQEELQKGAAKGAPEAVLGTLRNRPPRAADFDSGETRRSSAEAGRGYAEQLKEALNGDALELYFDPAARLRYGKPFRKLQGAERLEGAWKQRGVTLAFAALRDSFTAALRGVAETHPADAFAPREGKGTPVKGPGTLPAGVFSEFKASFERGELFLTLARLSALAERYPGDDSVARLLSLTVDAVDLLAFREGITPQAATGTALLGVETGKLFRRTLSRKDGEAEWKGSRDDLENLLRESPAFLAGWALTGRVALLSGDEALAKNAARTLLELGVQRSLKGYPLLVMAALEERGVLPWRSDWALAVDRELIGQAVELFQGAQAAKLADDQRIVQLKAALALFQGESEHYPDCFPLLVARAAAAVQLSDERSGRAAAWRLAGLGLAGRKDAALLAGALGRKGWLPAAGAAPGGTELVNSLQAKLVLVNPGDFQMGSPEAEPGRRGDEAQHPVRLLKAYFLSENQVTAGQWRQLMGRLPEAMLPSAADDLPVYGVSWDDAQEFCRRLSAVEGRRYRLPTEAEWEYAARGGTGTPFAFGAALTPAKAVYARPWGGPASVELGQPNAFGLKNVHGNVWQWCSDWYAPYPPGKQLAEDPRGPISGTERVLRGGSWASPEADCRSARRHHLPPDGRAGAGVRVALDQL